MCVFQKGFKLKQIFFNMSESGVVRIEESYEANVKMAATWSSQMSVPTTDRWGQFDITWFVPVLGENIYHLVYHFFTVVTVQLSLCQSGGLC